MCLIHELDNDALLILYLADELPPEDRADVEQQLGVDAVLRAGLASARAGERAATAALDAADRLDPPAGTSASARAVALRRVSRVMRQWQVDQRVRSRPIQLPERQPRFPRWAYPAAAAAAVLVATGVWVGWSRHAAGTPDHANPDYALNNPGQASGLGRWGGGGWPGHRRPDGAVAFNIMGRSAMFVGDAFGTGSGSTPGLADAEQEATALRHVGDPAGMSIDLSDGASN